MNAAAARTLYLLRHAQTKPSGAVGDKERELTPNGIKDAQALGQILKDKEYTLEYALCSPANRTKKTLETLSQNISKIEYPEKLYNASSHTLLELIQETPDDVKSLIVIAHNPGIHELAATLAHPESPSTLMARLIAGYSPGTISAFSCPTTRWLDLRPGKNTLFYYLEPLDYNAPATPARWT